MPTVPLLGARVLLGDRIPKGTLVTGPLEEVPVAGVALEPPFETGVGLVDGPVTTTLGTLEEPMETIEGDSVTTLGLSVGPVTAGPFTGAPDEDWDEGA